VEAALHLGLDSFSMQGIAVGEPGLGFLIAEGFTPVEAAYALWLVFRVAITSGPERDASFTGFVGNTGKLLEPDVGGELQATRQVHHAPVANGPHDTFDFDVQVVPDRISGWLAAKAASPQAARRRQRRRR
jgi:hypothetical protein